MPLKTMCEGVSTRKYTGYISASYSAALQLSHTCPSFVWIRCPSCIPAPLKTLCEGARTRKYLGDISASYSAALLKSQAQNQAD